VSQETHVQRAFQATAALFRALGVSQNDVSRELGLRGHTSFSFWKGGNKEFQGKYALALYKIVTQSVNEHWPHRPDDQDFVIRKLIAVIAAWTEACRDWRRDLHEALQRLQRTASRTQQFGNPDAPSYGQELQHIAHEISQLSTSLDRIAEFESAWERGGRDIEAALEDAERRHLQTKAAQPPARQKGPRRPAQRKVRGRARV